jgi:hypothetical protein
LSNYLSQLKEPLPPLTRREKILFASLFTISAIARLFALSASQLDWDESLFSCAVREYDVVPHHPHPPGYPLFILFAKLARLAAGDDFRSLQSVATLASILIFPAAFSLVRELRFPTRVAFSGAILTSFLPTLLYYGGTALSDVPAIATALGASAMLLRGVRDTRAWYAGMLLAGVLAGIRPQHGLIIIMPALISIAGNFDWKRVIRGTTIAATIAAASYIGAAYASSDPPFGYLEQAGLIVGHIENTDSFQNPTRPPLRELAPRFFLTPHRGGMTGHLLLALAAIAALEGILRRQARILILLLMFVPIAVLSWMMLDTTAVTRYGLAYVVLYPLLAASALETIARQFDRFHRSAATVISAGASAAIVVALVIWVRPALAEVRRVSPPVAAMAWLRENAAKETSVAWLDDSLGYHALYQLDGFRRHFFRRYEQIPLSEYRKGNYCLVDRVTIQPHAELLRFDRDTLGRVARTSYFEVSLIPMEKMIRFTDGWYHDEFDRETAWRWMRKASVTHLPPSGSTRGRLSMRFGVPELLLASQPTLVISVNGRVVDRVLCNTHEMNHQVDIDLEPERWSELRMEIDRTARPAENGLTTDRREFGLQFFALSLEPMGEAAR